MPSSSCVVKTQCDNCGKITKNEYRYYLKHNHNLKTYCNKCSLKLFNSGENHTNWGNKYTPTGENHPNWGNKYTPTGENHWNYGNTWSEETKYKNMMSQQNRKRVRCIETGEEFESISSQFPEVSNETLIYETVRRLNLLKDKRKLTKKDKMFLNLYNNGCLKR